MYAGEINVNFNIGNGRGRFSSKVLELIPQRARGGSREPFVRDVELAKEQPPINSVYK